MISVDVKVTMKWQNDIIYSKLALLLHNTTKNSTLLTQQVINLLNS